MEDSIIIEAQNKNEQALLEVCTNFKPIVKRIARKYFLVDGEMEDLIQEGMIGLHKAIMNYSPAKGKFEPFAIMIIKQQILDAVRKSTRMKNGANINKISIERNYLGDAEQTQNVLEVLEKKEEFNERFRNIEKLLSKKEFLIFSDYLNGLSIKEISEKEVLTVKSVDNALFRIKSKLKKGVNING